VDFGPHGQRSGQANAASAPGVSRRKFSHSAAIVGGSAAIGALAGGGKGAAIGALAGVGAGYHYDRKTHKKRAVVRE